MRWRRAGVGKPDVVAATIGPGLAGALLVGVAAAKAYSAAWGVPFYAVNHLGGHLAADVYEHGPLPECVALLVSGGAHPSAARAFARGVDGRVGQHRRRRRRRGRRQGGSATGSWISGRQGSRRLSPNRRPAGPSCFRAGWPGQAMTRTRSAFPDSRPPSRGMWRATPTSGTRRCRRRIPGGGVADVLVKKAVRAATELGVSTLLIAGGVAANSRLRELATQRCAAAGLTLRIPKPRLCTDNGAMIASFAAHLVAAGASPSPLNAPSDPGLPVVTAQVS